MTVKIGMIGLGERGKVLFASLGQIAGIEIAAICDTYDFRVEEGTALCAKYGWRPWAGRDYRELLKQDLDAVIITTTWTTHTRIAADAMRAGKHVGLEVGGAACEQECWELVRVSEETGKFCMLLENCCYADNELMLFHMAKQGLFGEIVHTAGGYEHDLREQIVTGLERKHGRMRNFLCRNGELYPTHQLGPICKLLGINRGNRLLSLVSVASKARGLRDWARRSNQPQNLQDLSWNQGDIVTTILKCANGETITLTHGCSLPRPYSRNGKIQGTRGVWVEDAGGIYIEPETVRVTGQDDMHEWVVLEEYRDRYRHPLWKEYVEKHGISHEEGHNDIDYLVLCAFIDSIQHGEPPIDVYDAAVWMAVTYLSEQSVAMGGQVVPVPDFTRGEWIERRPERIGKYMLSEVRAEAFERE